MTQPANPLQLGQTLYEVLDTTVVATPKGASTATYQRITYTSSGGTAADQVVLAEGQADFLDVKACTDMHAGVQDVFLLSHEQLQRIGTAGSVAWPVQNALLIVDFDPQRTDTPCVLLVGADATGAFLTSFDTSAGTAGAPLRLPNVAGTPVAAALVRQQLDAHVVVLTENGGQLMAYDLGTSVLGASPTVGAATSVVIGTVTAQAPVGVAVDSLVPGTADQQAAVTYAGAGGALEVALLGWGKDGLQAIATATPDTAFAPPERPVFRAATADLVQAGSAQLVVGYPATYAPSPAVKVAGCAGLLLYDVTVDPTSKAIGLQLLSSTAIATSDQQPVASIDLHLAAGLFGGENGFLGVIVIGGGATMQQLMTGEASVMACYVPVDVASRKLPAVGATVPATPTQVSVLQTIDYQATSFFAVPSDVTGQSVVLGPPTMTQTLGRGQLLAIVQAPPYDSGVSSGKPSLTFGQTDSNVKGLNVSSNKTWMFSKDTGATIGIGGQTLGQTVNQSYGHGFDQVTDNSTSTLVQTTTTITQDDLIVLYAMSYYVWTYPVFRKSVQPGPDGTLAVIFPMTPQPEQMILPASDPSIGYVPRSQQGLLTSYLNVDKDGYGAGETLLFELIGVAVTQDTGGTTVLFDQSKMVTDNISKTTMVHNTTSDSAHFSLSTTLLDYVPINFGLNLSDSDSYSDNEVETTMLSHTTSLSITVSNGSVRDIGYEYVLTPYIYQHATMGCLMVAYDVELRGADWASHYNMPAIVLPALYPDSSDAVLAAVSRSISFGAAPNPDGTTTVTVELLNSGLTEASSVVCDFYKGKPTVATGSTKPSPVGDVVATQTVPTLAGTARTTVSADLPLTDGDVVTVDVYPSGLAVLGKVYWNVYPASAFASTPAAAVAAAAA